MSAELKMKDSMIACVQMVVSILVIYPCDHMADWELPLPSITREYHSHRPLALRKDPKSKFKVQFVFNAYHFCTNMRLNNCKLNCHKLGTTCKVVSPLPGCFMAMDIMSDGETFLPSSVVNPKLADEILMENVVRNIGIDGITVKICTRIRMRSGCVS